MRELQLRELGSEQINGLMYTIVAVRVYDDGNLERVRIRKIPYDVDELTWIENAMQLYKCDRWSYQTLLRHPWD